MNRFKKFTEYFQVLFKKIANFLKSKSMSTQLIITIILIFLSFFVLQMFLNQTFFDQYYSEREFERINSNLMDYVDDLNATTDDNYYNTIYAFTTENNAYSVIVDGQYSIVNSSHPEYTITVLNTSDSQEYKILVPNNDYTYQTSEQLEIMAYKYYNDTYTPVVITSGSSTIFNSGTSCADDSCVSITGELISINKPNNMNYYYDDNIVLKSEVSKLFNEAIDLDKYIYETGSVQGYWYLSTDGPIDSLVFVHELKRWNNVITVVPIVDTSDVISIVSGYNYYLYLTALAVIFIWSFRLSSIISKPIQNIELVAREIAQLNFNVEAHEYNNRENESLSNSINLISRNLKETLETVNTKNRELTDLNIEQSKQVTLKKQLVSSISHELKTPLMIMQVTIQGILDEIIEAEDQEQELNNVLDEINKSSLMIQDMLQIYRLDDANTELEMTEFNLSNTVRFFVQDFDNAIKKYNFDVDVNVIDDVYLEADVKLIKRVISNFITNAIKYTPQDGKIYIEVSELEDQIYFELTNYGINIDESELDNIWMPFYRIEQEIPTDRKTKGSGVGLYLVGEILKAHNAQFGIENVNNGVKAYFKINKKVE